MGFIKTTAKLTIAIVALTIGAALLVGSPDPKQRLDEKMTAQSIPNNKNAGQCARAKVTGVEYGITGSRINVRKGPGTNYEKIVNQKATAALGKTHYVQVDNSVTVLESCRQDDWSFIEVTKPEWLRESHKGWVASRFLREQARDATGVRVFNEEDFIWDGKTSPHKEIIVAAVNKIHRENSRCEEIDPSSAYLSGSKSSPENPVFFVTCGSGANAFNVWFSKEDLDDKKVFGAQRHIEKANAISLCEMYARNAAAYPDTVDFSRVIDLAISEHPNGRTTINSTFTARNNLNLQLKFNIRCLLDATGLIEATVHEAS